MKVAVIGAGHMGRLHADKFSRCEGAELVAVVDPDAARAEAVAQPLGAKAFPNFKDIFGVAEAAVIAAPTERHHEIAAACLGAGLHVLVEKPIARTLAEADELVALAEKKNCVLEVGHVERYNRAMLALFERVERPVFIDAERLSAFKVRGSDVDVILDVMIHDLDLAAGLARSPVESISACGFSVLTGDIDIANVRIEFASGCVANISASRVSQTPVRKLRVFSNELYVSADLQGGKLRFVRRHDGRIDESEERFEGDALSAQAAAFVAAVRAQAERPRGREGRRALELALEVGRLVRERLKRVA
ncbi:MAG TPA: Gfo/Idh/MocA family oxidoreductase [Burkholderiales bacterium]|nr:Gfo/Idh/MocA family oxidoreductase [Burkholderiales bacterium]